jgi:hypothetical protein
MGSNNRLPIDWDWLTQLSQAVPAFQWTIDEVVRQLGLTDDEARQTGPLVAAEFRRLLPSMCKAATIVALLPLIAERSRCQFLGKPASRSDAGDLSQAVAARILTALFGSWPRGNVGAWVAAVRKSAGLDHGRPSRLSGGNSVVAVTPGCSLLLPRVRPRRLRDRLHARREPERGGNWWLCDGRRSRRTMAFVLHPFAESLP